MIIIELYTDDDKLLETAEFPSVPRDGEHIAILSDDYFKYYSVVKVWYRRDQSSITYVACVQVSLID